MKGRKIEPPVREVLLKTIAESGASIKTCCEILLLSERRYYHWKSWQEPAKRVAWNKLLPAETAAILEVARREEQADLRAAGLMVHGHETNKYYCSPSTVRKTLKAHDLAAPYEPRKRSSLKKPEIRNLLTAPNKVYCYDATDFYLTSGLTVPVVSIMDIFSRKNLNSGVYLRSFRQKEVKALWDETLFKEGVNTEGLVILSDNGRQMKGGMTKEHLSGQWRVTLVHSRPHTPDDNPWIEAFIKGLKYHPACPESFATVQEVMDWVNWYQEYYNNHPHSALGYVRPNEEHRGLGKAIRQQRKDNLKLARKERLAYYYECKARIREQKSSQRLEVVHNSFALC